MIVVFVIARLRRRRLLLLLGWWRWQSQRCIIKGGWNGVDMPDVLGVRMALDLQIKDMDDGAGGRVVKEGKVAEVLVVCTQDLSETGGFCRESRRIRGALDELKLESEFKGSTCRSCNRRAARNLGSRKRLPSNLHSPKLKPKLL